MILLCSNALPRLEISSIEKFLNAGGIIRARIISMNGSGCCDSRERKREGCKRKKKRRKEKRWKGTSIRGAKAALLYLWHALLTPATFPLEESFSPPAGIRPSVGWTSRNASRICNVTARLSSRFFSLLLSSSVYSSWEGTSFHASSPWETWKHRARRNIFRRVPRRFPPKISYTSFHKGDTMIPWNFHIFSIISRVRIVYRFFYNQIGWNKRGALRFSFLLERILRIVPLKGDRVRGMHGTKKNIVIFLPPTEYREIHQVGFSKFHLDFQ